MLKDQELRIKQLDQAIFEANRFIERAKAWKAQIKDDELSSIAGSREGGACKRASMDLTNSLVPLRRSVFWGR